MIRRELSTIPSRPRTLLMLLGLVLMSALALGCGRGDGDIETDPAEGTPPMETELPTVDLDQDQPFGGEGLDQGGAEGEDVGEEMAAPSILLADVFFEFNKHDLSDEGRTALSQNGRLLREHGSVNILIEGHCDERGTVQYNLALGEKRANEVKRYLEDLGISGMRISVVSYGKEKPFVLGHTEEAWSQNRRAHFVIR